MGNLPQHVAVIMDGNGRWAKVRGLSREKGHKRGVKRAMEIIEVSRELDIKALTLYAFSSENWERPLDEVNVLMRLLEFFLRREMYKFKMHDIAFRAIGDLNRLPASAQRIIAQAEELTRDCKGMSLTIAISYGGKDEIVRATRKIIASGIEPHEVNEDVLSRFLDNPTLPDPDLVIRTSGVKRLSNFFLWQVAHSKFYFTDILWPDYDREQFLDALRKFRREYNEVRPHSSLNNLAPKQFKLLFQRPVPKEPFSRDAWFEESRWVRASAKAGMIQTK